MLLPDLGSDIRFPKLAMTPEAEDWSFAVKRKALGPHIEVRWGWDEALQKRIHHERFVSKPFFAIERRGYRPGVLSWAQAPDHIQFGEFYVLPEHQKQGLGEAILSHCLDVADRVNLPVRLEYLHWNPVGSLYRRHGFAEVGRSDIHVFLERPPQAPVG
jgi:GNAT superfamily N-acetyltransferase